MTDPYLVNFEMRIDDPTSPLTATAPDREPPATMGDEIEKLKREVEELNKRVGNVEQVLQRVYELCREYNPS